MTTPAVTPAQGTSPERPVPVVDAIREAIVIGEFAANQRLVEADLAERFAASRGSVRAALLQLGAEGLVERVPAAAEAAVRRHLRSVIDALPDVGGPPV